MANNCENRLRIDNAKNIEDIFEILFGDRNPQDNYEKLSYDRVVPFPGGFASLVASKQRKWLIENFGQARQEARDPVCHKLSESSGQITFDSANDPPLNLIKNLSALFPEARFNLKYFEAGNWLAGTAICINGTLEDNRIPHSNKETIKEFAENEMGWEDFDWSELE